MERKETGIDFTSYLMGKKSGGGGGGSLQTKSVEITQNGSTTISADEGYSGLSAVNLTTNVPADVSEYFYNSGNGGTSSPWLWQKLVKKIPTFTLTGTSLRNAFNYYLGVEIPDIINFENSTSFASFCADCQNIVNIDLSNKQFNTSAANFGSMFARCTNLIEANLSSLGITSTNTDLSNMFGGCTSLKKINLSNLAPASYNSTSQMFQNCTSLEELDISSMNFSNIGQWTNNMFAGVPDNCLIYVKDQTAKTWFTNNWSNLTNVQIKGA